MYRCEIADAGIYYERTQEDELHGAAVLKMAPAGTLRRVGQKQQKKTNIFSVDSSEEEIYIMLHSYYISQLCADL